MKRVILLTVQVLLTVLIVTGCGGGAQNEKQSEKIRELESRLSKLENETSNENAPSNNFKEVRIGNQVWMAENLNVDKFRNGDPIPHAKTDEEWKKAGIYEEPAWCYYDNDPANGEKYGKLYNWHTVVDPRGLAPEGWHIPSDAEWTTLTDYLGGEIVAETKIKSTTGWFRNGHGTNESGFSGLPGGYRYSSGLFDYLGETGGWWSSTEDKDTKYVAWLRVLYNNYDFVHRHYDAPTKGYSLRCLRD